MTNYFEILSEVIRITTFQPRPRPRNIHFPYLGEVVLDRRDSAGPERIWWNDDRW